MAKRYYWGAFILDSVDLFIRHDLNKFDYSIFFLLCKEMDKDTNITYLRQIDIKGLFEDKYERPISKSTISKSISKLAEKTFITKSKNRPGFMINPSLFYYGSTRYMEVKIKDFEENLENNRQEPIFFFDKDEGIMKDYDDWS